MVVFFKYLCSFLGKNLPLLQNTSHLMYCINSWEPLANRFIFDRIDFEVCKISELIEVKKICYGRTVSINKITIIDSQYVLKFLNARPHLLPLLQYFLLFKRHCWNAGHRKLTKRLKKCQPKVILIPREIFIQHCFLLNCSSVKMFNLLIFLANIS